MRVVFKGKKVVEDWRKRNPELDQRQIAERAGVAYSTFSKYMNGNVNSINLEVLLKLCEFFGVEGHELVDVVK